MSLENRCGSGFCKISMRGLDRWCRPRSTGRQHGTQAGLECASKHLKKSLTALLRITWLKLICERSDGRAAAADAVSSCRRDRLIVLTATCSVAEILGHKLSLLLRGYVRGLQ